MDDGKRVRRGISCIVCVCVYIYKMLCLFASNMWCEAIKPPQPSGFNMCYASQRSSAKKQHTHNQHGRLHTNHDTEKSQIPEPAPPNRDVVVAGAGAAVLDPNSDGVDDAGAVVAVGKRNGNFCLRANGTIIHMRYRKQKDRNTFTTRLYLRRDLEQMDKNNVQAMLNAINRDKEKLYRRRQCRYIQVGKHGSSQT